MRKILRNKNIYYIRLCKSSILIESEQKGGIQRSSSSHMVTKDESKNAKGK